MRVKTQRRRLVYGALLREVAAGYDIAALYLVPARRQRDAKKNTLAGPDET